MNYVSLGHDARSMRRLREGVKGLVSCRSRNAGSFRSSFDDLRFATTKQPHASSPWVASDASQSRIKSARVSGGPRGGLREAGRPASPSLMVEDRSLGYVG